MEIETNRREETGSRGGRSKVDGYPLPFFRSVGEASTRCWNEMADLFVIEQSYELLH